MRPSRHVASGRAALATYVAGTGAPVVFLHANVCDSRMWRAQLEEIAAGRTAIAYDRRGFGETQAEAEDFSSVADLMAVIDATTSGEPVVLVGCSRGGKIAIDAALRHPSHVRALVLIAPGMGGAPDATHPPEIADLLARLDAAEAAGDLDRANALKAHLWLDGPRAPEGRVGGEVRRLFLDMNGIALRSPPVGEDRDVAPAFDRLGEVEVPSLVIWGDHDFPHIQARSRELARRLPNGAGRELQGTAHLPSLEQPMAVTSLLTAFLDTHRG